jgi:hypothetical protein
MGLDMYAYTAAKAGQQREFWQSAELDPESGEFVSRIARPREIAYWRKHPNLHGWFEQEWRDKHYPDQPSVASEPNVSGADMFNSVELEITWDMLERLEQAIVNKELPSTTGFFFGDSADDYYREQDLQFIQEARAELFLGLRVFYNSSW